MITKKLFAVVAGLAVLALIAASVPPVSSNNGRGSGYTVQGMGGGMGGGTIDPPIGSALVDLPTVPDENRMKSVMQVSLDARLATVDVNGTPATLFTYNGLFPGPVIRLGQGTTTLKVKFTNSLPYTTETNYLGFQKNITNLHTHGLHTSPMEPSDAAHIQVLPKGAPDPGMQEDTYWGRHDYKYDVSLQEPGCLLFYHGHKHGVSAEQFWGGMTGVLEVADPPTVHPSLPTTPTHIMMLKDIDIENGAPAPHDSMMSYMRGMEGSTIMVNGQVNPYVVLRPNEIQRWRILNASTARFYKLSLEGHMLNVIGTDGGLLDKPYPQSYVVMAPGERIDVLVQISGNATAGSKYKLLSLPYARTGMMNSAQITLMTVKVEGTKTSETLPTWINPNATRLTIDTSSLPKKTFVLDMSMGRGTINGKDFDVDPDTTMSVVGTYEVWEVINNSNMDHPWHQHVNAAQVISITGGDAAYRNLYTTAPARKDTIIVPKGGRMKLLMPVMDFTGMTMYHCHILEHEDIGMMGMWHIMDMP